MKRETWVVRGAFLLGLTASGAVAACSAGGKSDGPGFSTGAGSTQGGGFGNIGNNGGGGFDPSAGGAGQGGFGNIGNNAGGTQGGGGNGQGGASVGYIGPPTINNCQDTSKFQGGSSANRIVYPYDGTIFPRGLAGPLLMWDAQADQILIEAKSSAWSYTDCPQTPDKVRFKLDDQVWAGAGSYSNGPADPLVVKITALVGGAPAQTVTVNLMFALATLKGAIYYNTYGSKLAANNGAVLKLLPGGGLSLFLTDTGIAPLGPCRSCHALSANGMMMTANHHFYPGSYISESYDVTGPTPTLIQANIPEAGFAGIYPDGSRLITNGPPNISNSAFFPTAPGNVTALIQSTSKMLDTKTSQPMNPVGWDAPHAQMPMFSPDGKHIVYNDYDKGNGKGHTLVAADYDYASNAFSNQHIVWDDASTYAAWPFYTPDSKQIVFATDSRADFTSQVPDIFGPPAMTPTGRGKLIVIDAASGQATPMDLANGYKGGQSYLPAGESRDNNLEFFPTVSPIAAGGFYWAMFTSRRTYGNLWTPGLEDPVSKKIWVTAISADQPAGTDPSHPAFLLPGQEIESGNVRAFAALEPCKEDGQACSAGSECCKGFCSNIDPNTGVGICGKIEVNQCARLDDKCTSDADCCTDENNGAAGRKLYCLGLGICSLKGAK